MGFNQNLLNDITKVANTIAGVANAISGIRAGGASSSNVVLRDFKHAAKTFQTNSYQYAPKLKFLFHTYFDLNVSVDSQANYGLLVKDIKLPSFTFQNEQKNQYNRKRIIQTKIKYDPVEITFHDDNGNLATKLWEAYYQYYYNDSTKIGSVLGSGRGSTSSKNDYNTRNIYKPDISGDDDWGFNGGQTDTATGTKKPFFKNITIFGFNQHNFTAYTLVNPVISNFSHDTYNYAEGGGTMTNRMSIDYETVVYNYGAMDGRNPSNIVTGFGDVANYDTDFSPISGQGPGTVLGRGGLVDAAGGFIDNIKNGGSILDIVKSGVSVFNSVKQLTSPGNNINIGKEVLNGLNRLSSQNSPSTRNAAFDVPVAAASPGPVGIAGSPTVNASTSPQAITKDAVATGPDGVQYGSTTVTGKIVAPNLSISNPEPYNETITVTAGSQYSGNNLTYSLISDPPFNGG